MFEVLGGKRTDRWEEVVAMLPARYEEVREEAKQLGALLDKSVLSVVEANNDGILRYALNQLVRIKKCVDDNTLKEVKRGNGLAIERALRKLLLNNWEGPIVRLLDDKEQSRINKRDEAFEEFVKLCRNWVDPNTQVLALGGDAERQRMAANQIHYKTLKGIVHKEYDDSLGDKSYVEALLRGNFEERKGNNSVDKEGWKVVNYRKSKRYNQREPKGTIFVAKIQHHATAKDVWNFFQKGGKILDIILPKKHDKYNNRIGFVKVQNIETAQSMVNLLKGKELLGSKLDLKVIQDKQQRKIPDSKKESKVSRAKERESNNRTYQ